MSIDADMHALLDAVKASSRSPADAINILRGRRQRSAKAATPAEAGHRSESASPDDSRGT